MVAKPLCPSYKNIIKPLDRARYPELRSDNIEHQDKGELVANCDQLQNDEVVVTTPVESRIMSIRGKQIMIDRDLAELYGVETKRLNEAVKRNIELLILEIRINPYTKDFTPIEKTLQEYDRLGITIY